MRWWWQKSQNPSPVLAECPPKVVVWYPIVLRKVHFHLLIQHPQRPRRKIPSGKIPHSWCEVCIHGDGPQGRKTQDVHLQIFIFFQNLSINQQAWVFRVLDSSICAFRLGVRIIFSRFKNHRKLFQFVGPLLATSALEPKWLRFNLLPGLLGKQQTTQGPQIQDLNHNDESMMRIMVFLNSPGPRGNKEYMTYCLMFGDTEPVWFNNK